MCHEEISVSIGELGRDGEISAVILGAEIESASVEVEGSTPFSRARKNEVGVVTSTYLQVRGSRMFGISGLFRSTLKFSVTELQFLLLKKWVKFLVSFL